MKQKCLSIHLLYCTTPCTTSLLIGFHKRSCKITKVKLVVYPGCTMVQPEKQLAIMSKQTWLAVQLYKEKCSIYINHSYLASQLLFLSGSYCLVNEIIFRDYLFQASYLHIINYLAIAIFSAILCDNFTPCHIARQAVARML